jgi:group I intron endonuclease
MQNNNKIIGIYKITNPEGHCYIGQSIDIFKRFDNHKKGINSNKLLYDSISKYGIENHTFEILEECDYEFLNIREKFYICFYKEKTLMFNSESNLVGKIKHQRNETKKRVNTLNTLIFNSGLSKEDFAKLVGVNYGTLMSQTTKDNTIEYTIKYARILGIKTISGYESGVYVELVIG